MERPRCRGALARRHGAAAGPARSETGDGDADSGDPEPRSLVPGHPPEADRRRAAVASRTRPGREEPSALSEKASSPRSPRAARPSAPWLRARFALPPRPGAGRSPRRQADGPLPHPAVEGCAASAATDRDHLIPRLREDSTAGRESPPGSPRPPMRARERGRMRIRAAPPPRASEASRARPHARGAVPGADRPRRGEAPRRTFCPLPCARQAARGCGRDHDPVPSRPDRQRCGDRERNLASWRDPCLCAPAGEAP